VLASLLHRALVELGRVATGRSDLGPARGAQDRPSDLKGLVADFARRDDVAPAAFGFTLDSTPDGPRYRWAQE
jgi:hypothetical protein